jgi:hypothetical protein
MILSVAASVPPSKEPNFTRDTKVVTQNNGCNSGSFLTPCDSGSPPYVLEKFRNQNIVVLHQNVCSLRAKATELEVLVCSELKYVDVLCLTENWQSNHKLTCINITDFKLVPFVGVVVNMEDLVSM